MIVLKTIDAHVGGSPLRLLTEGFPSPHGRTMAEKLRWAERHASGLRRALMREPRGHVHMCGAVLTEPCTADAHAGVLFMDSEAYLPLSGHGALAVASIARAHGLITTEAPEAPLVIDTAVGQIRATIHGEGKSATVDLVGCPAFVIHAGLDVALPSRSMRVDVAFGGAFYALVDSESAGVPLLPRREAELVRVADAIRDYVERELTLRHPVWPEVKGLRGVVFTGPAQTPGADLRVVAVSASGRVSRAPSGTGLAAVMAVLSAMGLPPEEPGVLVDGLVGTRLHGRIVTHTLVGEHDAVVPILSGSPWMTGEHAFSVDRDDPQAEGL